MSAEFFLTIGDTSQIPGLFNGDSLKGRTDPRIVFVGRSNVGKSSLLNSLTESKLAKVSAQPGKTRALHFYFWKDARQLVADLPGYGYAKAPLSERSRWERFIAAYLRTDPAIGRIVVLLDARHGPTAIDEQALSFVKFLGVPITLVMTKVDAIKNQKERSTREKEVRQKLPALGWDPEQVFWVSIKTGEGIRELAAALKRGDSE